MGKKKEEGKGMCVLWELCDKDTQEYKQEKRIKKVKKKKTPHFLVRESAA